MNRSLRIRGFVVAGILLLSPSWSSGDSPDPAAVERGRVALTSTGYLKPGWSGAAYRRAGSLWGENAPAADTPADAYAAAFNQRYGLHPAPFPNDGLPMGLRRAGEKSGMQIDCMVCHGGSIGGQSYVGLGNTTLDMRALLYDLTRADDRRLPPSLFHLNTARGTVNAGMISAVLLSVRNSDLSVRKIPLPLGANLPELDVPPWWHLARKTTMYYDGRTDARSVRSILQFFLAEKSLEELKELEPTFRDIQAYMKSLKPPKYPFAIDAAKAERGKTVFAKTCVKCHGTYGPDGHYPNRVVELAVIGTDPARAQGLSDRLVAHYNTTWLAEDYPADPEMVGYQAPPLDGIWATAPYLHNGSVPTLAALLKSVDRPARFKRPPSTGLEHYDQVQVGWKFTVVADPPSPPLPPFEAQFIYDTSRFGLSNGGHRFGDDLADEARSDLIEYLKTL
ncbi:c-type cytochrome [Singulisphaera acidiphila]|uniref:Cytochrome c peroxidase n=1 Tax=Singulisphaera acidiphila (strain ATCC BAA-1392 / DSM 18658 / VKM B-2454 / MOB10) TaxID=886293 RepID=L0DA61_SINAD|nr:c-type cytochrome [Singulisphaera acidiphila]AGA25723.1 cytochrome c peroxidase [Singulisphaera acidiphila DSM 18658]